MLSYPTIRNCNYETDNKDIDSATMLLQPNRGQMKPRETCPSCGATTEFRIPSPPMTQKVGLVTVAFPEFRRDVCTVAECADWYITCQELGATELIAALMALRDAPDAFDVDMIKFARKALGMTRPEFREKVGPPDGTPLRLKILDALSEAVSRIEGVELGPGVIVSVAERLSAEEP